MPNDHSFRILKRGTGMDGDDYLEVMFMSRGKQITNVIPARDLDSATALRKIGIVTSTSRTAFAAAAEVALRDMPSTFEVADRAGFFGNTYVWFNGGTTGEEVPVCLAPEYRHLDPLQYCGNLTAWTEFANLARGNTRVMLAICHAFTGPIVDLLGLEAPAIQLVGEAGVFKSSLCSIIALMWGMRPKSWHATDNGGEDVALAHHASHLVLDDLRVDRKHSYVVLRAYAIRLTDGRSKERRDEPGRTFRTPILSSSNRSLDEHARLAGLSMDVDQAALRGRLIDVPLVNGRTELFEVLHGRPSARDLIELMCDIAKENAGVPAVEFVARLQQRLCADGEALRQALTTARAFYETGAGAAFEDVPGYDLTRVHGRFATIYAAGRLAIDLGLLRWSPALLKQAIMDCEAAHVALTADPCFGNLDGSPLVALRRYVDQSRHTFIDLRDGLLEREGHDYDACPGYINLCKDGSLELLFPYAKLERICGGRATMPLLRFELRDAGSSVEGEARPSVKRFIYRGKDPNERVNVVAVRADIFDPFAPAT